MPGTWKRLVWAAAFLISLLLTRGFALRSVAQSRDSSPAPQIGTATITNLAQLSRALAEQERLCSAIELDLTVCASSRPRMGALVVQDETGVELLELGRRAETLLPGERIRLSGGRVLLRRRKLGVQISAAPVVDNDGLHGWRVQTGQATLEAGRVPLELDWFNCLRNFGLGLFQDADGQSRPLPVPSFWHLSPAPQPQTNPPTANATKGLWAEAYEGYWEALPDFDLLKPVKTGTTTNCDVGFRSRDELVALRFTGFFEAPTNGTYTFRLGSDDGAMLFVGAQEVSLRRLGTGPVPAPAYGWIGQPMKRPEERLWLAVEGRVSFFSRVGEGLELELRSGPDTLWVRVADAGDLKPEGWLNAYVRAEGVGRAGMSSGRRVLLDELAVASSRDLRRVKLETGNTAPLAIESVSHVQTLRLEDAKRGLPVRVRGVITAASRADHWCSLQDDTRGIFVSHPSQTNAYPEGGELWEVAGHTEPGNFAPVIVADQMRRLGPGRMPEPARPGWSELANGSMDVQRVEFHGVVSGVQSNRLTLLMPEGPLDVQMENYFEPELSSYRQAVVRIRGTLFAIWNAGTREVQFGHVLMRNALVSVEVPPPVDPFDIPVRSARDLLLFDPQANALHPVKVRAQVLYSEAQQVFAMDAGSGLRVIAAETVALQPGDWFEAVGYPEISGPSPVLQQALLRKTGAGRLPKATVLPGAELPPKALDSTLVCVDGKLMGAHVEQHSPVLEMQSGGQVFVARVQSSGRELSLRPGSQLQLTGVYVQTGRTRRLGGQAEAFELLVNSPEQIRVVSQPSWWTLERLAAVVGILLVVLSLAGVWITQLHRLVDQRTAQLQQETRQRERAERQRAIEAERSRIARDLHDDLGSSLTEIGVLASTGVRRDEMAAALQPGCRPPEPDNSSLFRNIAAKARGLIAAMDVIVWAVDPDDNSLQSLADYLSGFAGDFLSHSGLQCRFKIPVVFPTVTLGGQVRHGLLMVVKESLNNVVRHSAATQVEFGMAVGDAMLEIVITDNGKGFNASTGADGHGLRNLPARLQEMGGTCRVHSVPGQGTTVTIRLPLSAPVDSDAKSVAV